ncbi:MAG TPA: DegT/DnrJ/EryC1/StrS family aminotransferase, partial [Gammaproteobacteria bacterium]|nr:DegT/DnrJ/EryC1/StrS family aminotransferase [Gammaproteobacteria bacterium]
EGGAVVSTDPGCIARASRALNFGFWGSRDTCSASINGKLSEYHAAVGLAEFDGWDAKRAEFAEVAAEYHRQFDAAGLGGRLLTSPEISASYVLYRCARARDAARIGDELLRNGVDFRYWYGAGVQRQSHYRTLRRAGPLRHSARVASCVLGLPCAPDLDAASIARVAAAVAAAGTPA